MQTKPHKGESPWDCGGENQKKKKEYDSIFVFQPDSQRII